MSRVRPFRREDVPAVAELRGRVFRYSERPSKGALARYLEEIFLNNPWRADDLSPLVAEGSGGKIIGFHGVIPRLMELDGRRIRVAVGSQFMIDPAHRGLAGLELLRAFLGGPQELSFADCSTEQLGVLWQRLGG